MTDELTFYILFNSYDNWAIVYVCVCVYFALTKNELH